MPTVVERRAHHGHKHDRVLDHQARIQFLERRRRSPGRQCSNQKENEICAFIESRSFKRVFPCSEEVLDDRPERERREKIQRADQQDWCR